MKAKKAISLFLALVMAMSCMSVSAWANEETYSVNDQNRLLINGAVASDDQLSALSGKVLVKSGDAYTMNGNGLPSAISSATDGSTLYPVYGTNYTIDARSSGAATLTIVGLNDSSGNKVSGISFQNTVNLNNSVGLTLQNLKIIGSSEDANLDGNEGYYGILEYATSLLIDSCEFTGSFGVLTGTGTTCTIRNSTFAAESGFGKYPLWLQSQPTGNTDTSTTVNNVKNCTFTTSDAKAKAIKIYKNDQTVNIEDCTFTCSAENGEKAAIEIDANAYSNTIVVNIKDCQQTGHSGMYNNKKSEATVNESSTSASTYVAQIGSTKYETFEAAFAAAKDGETITLLADVTDAVSVSGGKNLTVALAGHKLGEFSSNHWVTGDATLTFDGTVAGSTVYGCICVGYSKNNNGNVVLNGGSYLCGPNNTALHINGTCLDSDVTINGATIESVNDNGIQLNGSGTFSIKNSSITGATGVYVKSGTLTIENSTITGNMTPVNYSYYGNGANATGDALVIDSCEYPGGAPTVVIKSGTFNGSKKAIGNYLYDDVNKAGAPVPASLTISGGTFNTDVVSGNEGGANATTALNAYVAAGYEATESNNTWTVQPETAKVAKIGTTPYATLEAAFGAAQDGNTIKLLDDVTLSKPLDVNVAGKSVTLDLGNNTLTGRTNLKAGNLTIQNGTVAGGTLQALNVYGSSDTSAENYSVLTINSDVTVTADVYAVCMFGATAGTNGYGAVINLAGTVNTTGDEKNGAVFVSGNLGQNVSGGANNLINITGSVTSTTDAALALNGLATVNVKNGAKITGDTAIAVKRGTLNVEDGAIVRATGAQNYPGTVYYNGTEMTGAAVSVTETYNQYGPLAVNITGGTFTSDKADAVYKRTINPYPNAATISITGGTFDSDPSAYVAAGYEAKAGTPSTGLYTVAIKAYTLPVTTDSTTEAIETTATTDTSTNTTTVTVTPVAVATASEVSTNANKTTTIKQSDLVAAATAAATDQGAEKKAVKIITGLSATQSVNGDHAPQTKIVDDYGKTIFEAVARGGGLKFVDKINSYGSTYGKSGDSGVSKANALDYVDLRLQYEFKLPDGVDVEGATWYWTFKYKDNNNVERTAIVNGTNYLPVANKTNAYTSNVLVINVPLTHMNDDFKTTLTITYVLNGVTYTVQQSDSTPLARQIEALANSYTNEQLAGMSTGAQNYIKALKQAIIDQTALNNDKNSWTPSN